jgi:hypothetical protein
LGRKTVTQTFRLDEQTCEELVAEADAQNSSLNALVNRVLEDYVTVDRFADCFQIMRFGRRLVAAIFDEISGESLKKLGETLGKTQPQEVLAAIGRPSTLENFIDVLERSHWSKCRISQDADVLTIHLRHDLTHKWSLFLCEYVCAMLAAFGYHNIETVDIGTHSVTTRFNSPSQ